MDSYDLEGPNPNIVNLFLLCFKGVMAICYLPIQYVGRTETVPESLELMEKVVGSIEIMNCRNF